MISKKEIVQNILQKLTPYREEAEWLSMVIWTTHITDDTIDALIHIISQSIVDAKNTQQSTIMKNAVTVIKKIQSQEQADSMLDQETADILLQDLELE